MPKASTVAVAVRSLGMRGGMRARLAMWTCWLAGCLVAGERSIKIADFEGANPLLGWAVSHDPQLPGVTGRMVAGSGHEGQGAVLEYQFSCAEGPSCRDGILATWTPNAPVAV